MSLGGENSGEFPRLGYFLCESAFMPCHGFQQNAITGWRVKENSSHFLAVTSFSPKFLLLNTSQWPVRASGKLWTTLAQFGALTEPQINGREHSINLYWSKTPIELRAIDWGLMVENQLTLSSVSIHLSSKSHVPSIAFSGSYLTFRVVPLPAYFKLWAAAWKTCKILKIFPFPLFYSGTRLSSLAELPSLRLGGAIGTGKMLTAHSHSKSSA